MTDLPREELRVEVFRAGPGPGETVTASRVRITHLRSGLVVDEDRFPTQRQNREAALRRLEERLGR